MTDRPGEKEMRPDEPLRPKGSSGHSDKKSPAPELSLKTQKKASFAEGAFREGIRLFRMKHWQKALDEFLGIKTDGFDDEERTELAYFLGLCYTKLSRYEEALLYLEQVVVAGQDVLRVYQCRMTLAYIYVITQRIRMAEFELKRLQNNGFESPQLYNTLAYAAWTRKHYRNAIDLYEKALDIDENNTTAMNSMGYILVDAGIDIMRGLRLCRKAVDKNPQSPAYLDSLGWAYFKGGEPVEARTWLRRALDLAPDEQEIQKHFKIVSGEAV
ncbi:MAG: tetratricopeptide repeat protein [Treponema sp.]|jgi:tetratricopeptide (TPR) repeat protein|nr:tetratricopeptide repeat protein [Treponema sp.]